VRGSFGTTGKQQQKNAREKKNFFFQHTKLPITPFLKKSGGWQFLGLWLFCVCVCVG